MASRNSELLHLEIFQKYKLPDEGWRKYAKREDKGLAPIRAITNFGRDVKARTAYKSLGADLASRDTRILSKSPLTRTLYDYAILAGRTFDGVGTLAATVSGAAALVAGGAFVGALFTGGALVPVIAAAQGVAADAGLVAFAIAAFRARLWGAAGKLGAALLLRNEISEEQAMEAHLHRVESLYDLVLSMFSVGSKLEKAATSLKELRALEPAVRVALRNEMIDLYLIRSGILKGEGWLEVGKKVWQVAKYVHKAISFRKKLLKSWEFIKSIGRQAGRAAKWTGERAAEFADSVGRGVKFIGSKASAGAGYLWNRAVRLYDWVDGKAIRGAEVMGEVLFEVHRLDPKTRALAVSPHATTLYRYLRGVGQVADGAGSIASAVSAFTALVSGGLFAGALMSGGALTPFAVAALEISRNTALVTLGLALARTTIWNGVGILGTASYLRGETPKSQVLDDETHAGKGLLDSVLGFLSVTKNVGGLRRALKETAGLEAEVMRALKEDGTLIAQLKAGKISPHVLWEAVKKVNDVGEWLWKVLEFRKTVLDAIAFLKAPIGKGIQWAGSLAGKTVSFARSFVGRVDRFSKALFQKLVPDVQEEAEIAPGLSKTYSDGDVTGPYTPENGFVPGGDPHSLLSSGGRVALFVNGVSTPLTKHMHAAAALAKEINRPVVGIYNASGLDHPFLGFKKLGVLRDWVQSAADKADILGSGKLNPATTSLASLIKLYGSVKRPDGGFEIYAHSQGSLIVSNALRYARDEGGDISQVDLTTFGNAAWSMPKGIRSQHNYVFDSDLIAGSAGSSSALQTLPLISRLNGLYRGMTKSDPTLTSTTVLHHSGAFADPHELVGDGPASSNASHSKSYIANLKAFREMEGRHQGQNPVTRSSVAVPMALARGAGQAAVDAVQNTHAGGLMGALLRESARGASWLGSRVMGFYDWVMSKGQVGTEASTVKRSGFGEIGDVDADELRRELLTEGGPGEPLSAASMKGVYRFAAVDPGLARVHTGPRAVEAARGLRANAFAIGRDIFFGEGNYRPGSREGQALLAHELTHVRQHASGTSLYSGAANDDWEGEAQDVEIEYLSAGRGRELEILEVRCEIQGTEGCRIEGPTQERIDHICSLAVSIARESGSFDGDDLTTLDVDVQIDFERMSEGEAARTMADAIIACIRALPSRQDAGPPWRAERPVVGSPRSNPIQGVQLLAKRKSGAPRAKQRKSDPLIQPPAEGSDHVRAVAQGVDWQFIVGNEGNKAQGYILANPVDETGKPVGKKSKVRIAGYERIGNSAVTIAQGLDLGHDGGNVAGLDLPEPLAKKLRNGSFPVPKKMKPSEYAELSRKAADLVLKPEELELVNSAVKIRTVGRAEGAFNRNSNGLRFENLTVGQKTVVSDMVHQYGSAGARSKAAFKLMQQGKWQEAADDLESSRDAPAYLKQRNKARAKELGVMSVKSRSLGALQPLRPVNDGRRGLVLIDSQASERAHARLMARLANLAYGPKGDTLGFVPIPAEELGKKQIGSEMLNDSDSGFDAVIFRNQEQSIVIAYRGTESDGGRALKDWRTNLGQAFGMDMAQYRKACELAHAVVKAYPGASIELTGHSLGGGLATAAAAATGLRVTTFNAANVHPETYKSNDADPLRIPAGSTNYKVAGEPLTKLQHEAPGILRTVGALSGAFAGIIIGSSTFLTSLVLGEKGGEIGGEMGERLGRGVAQNPLNSVELRPKGKGGEDLSDNAEMLTLHSMDTAEASLK